MQYLIVKKKNKYFLIDTLPIELGISEHGTNITIKNTGDNKLYFIHEYEEVDDWYADTGYITHFEKYREYVGKIVFESDDIEEIALKYAEVKNGSNRIN